MVKKIFWILVAVVIAIQFIKPKHNEGIIEGPNYISSVLPVPPEVEDIMTRACFDCHSNQTKYPWYSSIQPVAWFLANHVNEGKGELNFSEFATYPAKKQKHKLEEVVESMKDAWMPLDSYTWMHAEARLTDAERTAVATWASESMDLIRE